MLRPCSRRPGHLTPGGGGRLSPPNFPSRRSTVRAVDSTGRAVVGSDVGTDRGAAAPRENEAPSLLGRPAATAANALRGRGFKGEELRAKTQRDYCRLSLAPRRTAVSSLNQILYC